MDPAAPAAVDTAILSDRLHLRIPSRPEWVEATVEFLHQRASTCGVCPEGQVPTLALALQEALLNAMVHGNLEIEGAMEKSPDALFAEMRAKYAADPKLGARPVDVRVDFDGQRCQWTITDQGKGFDAPAMLRLLEAGGDRRRGILIMKTFLDDVRFEDGGRSAVLTLQKSVDAAQRRQLRIHFQNPIEIFPLQLDGSTDYAAAYQAVCHELTPAGMVFLQTQPNPAAQMIVGVVCEQRVVFIPAALEGAEVLGDGMVHVECRFLSRFDPQGPAPSLDPIRQGTEPVAEAVARLENMPAPAHPADDRRSHTRVPYTRRVLVEGPEPVTAFARDFSKGGIALITPAALPLNEVRALVVDQPQGSSLRVTARIVRCSPIMNGFYDVGAQFLDSAAS